MNRLVPVPRLTLHEIEAAAMAILEAVAPARIKDPTPVNWSEVIDRLATLNIDVVPVDLDDPAEHDGRILLRDCEAATAPADDGNGATIYVRLDVWIDLLAGEWPSSNRAGATLAHEIAHAVLHRRHQAWVLRNSWLSPPVARGTIPDDRNPEVQAWRFAGFFLVPRPALETLPPTTPTPLVAQRFGVSTELLRRYLKRISMDTRFDRPVPREVRWQLGARAPWLTSDD